MDLLKYLKESGKETKTPHLAYPTPFYRGENTKSKMTTNYVYSVMFFLSTVQVNP